jgi:glycosyltransferase involved in cell wall biosynthesis
MSQPLVSVLMAALNHEDFAADAARSVLDQNYDRLELIAIDDVSDDSTAEALAECAVEAPAGRMRFLEHDRRAGIAETRAHALRLARGELIGVLDSDDLWLPGKLGPQVELLEHEPDLGLVHAEYEAFDSETGEPVPWGRDWNEDADQLVELVRVGCFIMTGTVLIRRAAIETRGLGFINPGYASYDDYLLYLTIALDWRIAHEDRVVMRYRRHRGNLTNVLFAQNLARARADLLSQFVRLFPEAKKRLGHELRRTLAHQLVTAAAHERSTSNLRALQWTLAAFRQEPAVAARVASSLVREKLAANGSRPVGG